MPRLAGVDANDVVGSLLPLQYSTEARTDSNDERKPRPDQKTRGAHRHGRRIIPPGRSRADSIAAFLETLPQRPVTPDESPDAVRGIIDADAPLPEDGTDAGALLQRTAPLLFDHSLFNGHPRFMGYVTSSPAPIP